MPLHEIKQHLKTLCTLVLAGLTVGSLLSSTITGCSSPAVKDREPASELYDEPEAIAEVTNTTKSKKPYFNWPVDSARMTRGFLPNRRRPHLGLDLAAPKNTPIYAAHDGVVIYAGRDFRGYGRMVMIEGKKGWATLYAHFNKIEVTEGQEVSQGELIGLMGRTGRATGVHLHFEMRKDKGPVDPLPYMPGGTRLAHR